MNCGVNTCDCLMLWMLCCIVIVLCPSFDFQLALYHFRVDTSLLITSQMICETLTMAYHQTQEFPIWVAWLGILLSSHSAKTLCCGFRQRSPNGCKRVQFHYESTENWGVVLVHQLKPPVFNAFKCIRNLASCCSGKLWIAILIMGNGKLELSKYKIS